MKTNFCKYKILYKFVCQPEQHTGTVVRVNG